MYLPVNINKECGIYKIINTRTGKFYIGSTKNAWNRKKNHFSRLKRGVHDNPHLQAAWSQEADKSVFEFQMFIYCDKDALIGLEQGCINFMNPDYNLNLVAGKPPSPLGKKASLETRAKMSAAKKGVPKTSEHRANMSAAMKTFLEANPDKHPMKNPEVAAARKGVPRSPETRAKISAALTGASLAPETRAKISAAQKGVPKTPEHRANMSAASKRPEVRAKNSTAQKALGDKHPSRSPESRAKISAAIKARGDKHHMKCPEARAKKSAAMKTYWAAHRKNSSLPAEANTTSDWPSEANHP